MYKSSGLPQGVALEMRHINDILCSQFIRHRKRTLDTNASLARTIKGNVTTARAGESATHFGEIEDLRLNLKTLKKVAENRKEMDEKRKGSKCVSC